MGRYQPKRNTPLPDIEELYRADLATIESYGQAQPRDNYRFEKPTWRTRISRAVGRVTDVASHLQSQSQAAIEAESSAQKKIQFVPLIFILIAALTWILSRLHR